MSVTNLDLQKSPELAFVLERSLAGPLRAVVAALGAEDGRLDGPRASLEEILRQAEATVDLFARRGLTEDDTTMRELAWCARALVPVSQRESVWIATEPGGETIVTDAPVCSRALAAYLMRAVRVGGEVLLHGHQEDGESTFAIVDDLSAVGDVLGHERASKDTPELWLARADLERLGAQATEHAAGPHRCTTIRIPNQPCKGEIR